MREITDKNMRYSDNLGVDDIVWYDYSDDCFSFYGISGVPNDEEIISERIPKKYAKENGLPVYQCAMAAGGRMRFSTDSPYVAISVKLGFFETPSILTLQCTKGFDLYELNDEGREEYLGAFRLPQDEKRGEYSAILHIDEKKMHRLTLDFPLFSEVKDIKIGIKQSYKIEKGVKYINDDTPTVFYGSSITQGGAASRSGHTYEAFISHNHNLNYINLGFAGHAKGEKAMAEYIRELKMNIFVCDYDHNAPNIEYLKNTHYKFYEIIREKNPLLPYIMMSRPDVMFYPKHSLSFRDVVKESYERALKNGDRNVYYIDGESLMKECGKEGFVDCTHPNDIGFYEMSRVIGKVISEIMNKTR